MAQHAAGAARRDDVRGHVASDDAAGSHDAVLADRHARPDDDTCPDPHVSAEDDGPRVLVAGLSLRGVDRVRGGARFFATNADRYCPVPGGGQPDAAAIIAAIEACTGRTVEAVVGKPSLHMANAVLSLVDAAPQDCLMTGDRIETDVLMGLEAGMDVALTLTGATQLDDALRFPVQPTYIIERLGDLLPPQAFHPGVS